MRRIAVFLLLVLTLAACGGGSETGDVEVNGPDVTDTPTQTPTQSPDGTGNAAAPPQGDADPPPDHEPGDEPVDALLLNGIGIDSGFGVLAFGTMSDQVIAAVTDVLGPPTDDTGSLPTVENGCPSPADTFRTVSWGGLELVFMSQSQFTEEPGEHLVFWFNPDTEVDAFSFIGDTVAVPIVNDETTVAELDLALGDAVTILEDDLFGPSFVINDNFGELRGELSGLGDTDVVVSANAGEGCGE